MSQYNTQTLKDKILRTDKEIIDKKTVFNKLYNITLSLILDLNKVLKNTETTYKTDKEALEKQIAELNNKLIETVAKTTVKSATEVASSKIIDEQKEKIESLMKDLNLSREYVERQEAQILNLLQELDNYNKNSQKVKDYVKQFINSKMLGTGESETIKNFYQNLLNAWETPSSGGSKKSKSSSPNKKRKSKPRSKKL